MRWLLGGKSKHGRHSLGCQYLTMAQQAPEGRGRGGVEFFECASTGKQPWREKPHQAYTRFRDAARVARRTASATRPERINAEISSADFGLTFGAGCLLEGLPGIGQQYARRLAALPFSDEQRLASRVVVHTPVVHQRPVGVEEVGGRAPESQPHVLDRHAVPAHPKALRRLHGSVPRSPQREMRQQQFE
jgi:hypothetical protein